MQPLIVLAAVVVLFSLVGAGILGQPWNEFNLAVQQLGWSEKSMKSPASHPSMELRLNTIPNPVGPPDTVITSCNFHSAEGIPAGIGLSMGVAICKLIDNRGVAIAEGALFFNSYTANDDLNVLITQKIFPEANHNQFIKNIKFIIQAPI